MTPIEQARKYIAPIPGAASGQNGHGQTFTVAAALANGFQLNESDAMELMREYNQRCQPPWSEAELQHKVTQAMTQPHNNPAGGLLNARTTSRKPGTSLHTPQPAKASPIPKSAAKPAFKLDAKVSLPEPMPDGTRAFLKAVFREGEGVSVCPAVLNDEESEIPDGSGLVLSREEWLLRLDKYKGNVNGIFRSSSGCGIYFRVNPMRVGGGKDSDVADFRYMLLESDKISLNEQWSFFQQCGLPIASITHSGGKSLHALVRLDAKNREEYNERVKIIYDHFSAYDLDIKNKNPSRFSRLPACQRFKSRQELLALNVGANSFLEWQTGQEIENLGQVMTIDDLLQFTPGEDPNCILGDRWLCKGGSCMIIGASGVGKSSLSMQAAILWGLERPFFGIPPKSALKSLFIQAENDLGDMAEMVQGVIMGMKLTPKEIGQIRSKVVIVHNSHSTGEAFTLALQRLIECHKPDLVWIDPLLSFIGDDVSKQVVCSKFLRNWVTPILAASGACLMMAHHTNKPPGDAKSRKGWTAADKAYMGAGSAELVNWSRSVIILTQDMRGQFDLLLAKRGKRAGMLDTAGNRTNQIKLAHAQVGICWEQVGEDQEERVESHQKEKTFDVSAFIKAHNGKGALSKNKILDLAGEWSRQIDPENGAGRSTIQKKFWDQIAASLQAEYDKFIL